MKIEIQLSEVEVALVAAAVILVAFIFNRKNKDQPLPRPMVVGIQRVEDPLHGDSFPNQEEKERDDRIKGEADQ